jgi:hypothetical protein
MTCSSSRLYGVWEHTYDYTHNNCGHLFRLCYEFLTTLFDSTSRTKPHLIFLFSKKYKPQFPASGTT